MDPLQCNRVSFVFMEIPVIVLVGGAAKLAAGFCVAVAFGYYPWPKGRTIKKKNYARVPSSKFLGKTKRAGPLLHYSDVHGTV